MACSNENHPFARSYYTNPYGNPVGVRYEPGESAFDHFYKVAREHILLQPKTQQPAAVAKAVKWASHMAENAKKVGVDAAVTQHEINQCERQRIYNGMSTEDYQRCYERAYGFKHSCDCAPTPLNQEVLNNLGRPPIKLHPLGTMNLYDRAMMMAAGMAKNEKERQILNRYIAEEYMGRAERQ